MFQKIRKLIDLVFPKKESNLELQEIERSILTKTKEILPTWDEIQEFEGFEKDGKIHILIAEDNKIVAKSIENTIKEILTKKLKQSVTHKTLQMIYSIKISVDDVSIKTVDDQLAVYRLWKRYEQYKDESVCDIDILFVDIIFGAHILRNNEILYLDGIDLVGLFREMCPKALLKIVTGCYLDNNLSKEKEKIINLLGEDFYKTNIFEKQHSYDARVSFIARALLEYQQKKFKNEKAI